MPNRISTGKLIQQQAKGVATGFASDLASTFVSNLFRRKQPQTNILARRDKQTRLSTLRAYLYKDNVLPAVDVIKRSSVNPYAIGDGDYQPEKAIGYRNSTPNAAKTDQRVKLDLGAGNRTFFKNDILAPLVDTRGVVFPYTPQLVVTHSANYIATPITHANFQHHTYSNSDIAAIQIAGDFSVQNSTEGLYLLAVIHFFRTVTKMYFGNDNSAPGGTPPPILFLSAYGTNLFDRVPVVVTSFVSTFPADVDYVFVNGAKGQSRVPTLMNMSVTVQPVFNRRQSKSFSLDRFARGDLLSQGYI
jgi:hypothetical protein